MLCSIIFLACHDVVKLNSKSNILLCTKTTFSTIASEIHKNNRLLLKPAQTVPNKVSKLGVVESIQFSSALRSGKRIPSGHSGKLYPQILV